MELARRAHALHAIALDPEGVAPYARVDLTMAPADERPDPADYDHYIALVECFKRHEWVNVNCSSRGVSCAMDGIERPAPARGHSGAGRGARLRGVLRP